MALCRTSPDQPKHKGITAFIVDMRAPGVEVRPLRQMTGGADFNEVFLTDVRVPDDHRLGNVDEGWRVALTTLMNERATVGGEGAAGPPSAVAAIPGRAVAGERPRERRRRQAAARGAACRHDGDRVPQPPDGPPDAGRRAAGPEASVSKLMYGQNLTRGTHFAAEVVGPRLTADTGEWGAFSWSELLLSTPALRILGGTEEIMKNILAERVLGLPKEPGIDTKAPFRELRR